MEVTQEQKVEILKNTIPIWPNIKVVNTGMSIDKPTGEIKVTFVRTVITLVRIKHEKYRLYEVRLDAEWNNELDWIEIMPTFLNQVKNILLFSNPEQGIVDNNQDYIHPIDYK